jgi:hypothetical protein
VTLGIALILIAQTGVGMVVNLYVTIPGRHPGAQPGSYFGGSLRGVAWAIGHGAPALAIHASLGLGIVAIALWLAIHAIGRRSGWVGATSVFAAFLVIGAGFNGASFLDFNDNVSSLLMALLALAALSCYVAALYLMTGRR